jgi:hypothetical protein
MTISDLGFGCHSDIAAEVACVDNKNVDCAVLKTAKLLVAKTRSKT